MSVIEKVKAIIIAKKVKDKCLEFSAKYPVNRISEKLVQKEINEHVCRVFNSTNADKKSSIERYVLDIVRYQLLENHLELRS